MSEEDGQVEGAEPEGMLLRGRVVARPQQQDTTTDAMGHSPRHPARTWTHSPSPDRVAGPSRPRSPPAPPGGYEDPPDELPTSGTTAPYVTAPAPPHEIDADQEATQSAHDGQVRPARHAIDLDTLFRAISMPAQPSAPTASAPQHTQPLDPSPSSPIAISSEPTHGGQPPDGPRAYAKYMCHNGHTLDIVQLMKFTNNTPKLRSPGTNSATSFANYTQSEKQLALAFPLLQTPLDAAIQRAS